MREARGGSGDRVKQNLIFVIEKKLSVPYMESSLINALPDILYIIHVLYMVSLLSKNKSGKSKCRGTRVEWRVKELIIYNPDTGSLPALLVPVRIAAILYRGTLFD